MKNIIFITVITIIIFIPFGSAGAATMSSSEYNLKLGNFNASFDLPENSDQNVGVLGQKNPKVRLGFEYTQSILPLRLSINETLIDFGVVERGTPVSRTHQITVYNGSANGYTVYATQSSQLMDPTSKAIIPDTTCDNGSCTQSSSAAWVSALTYGFGYRCDNETGTDCERGFLSSEFYKQFPNWSKNETMQAVMTGTNVGINKRAKITYKLNISATQPKGHYQNIVTYIAVPTY